MPSNQATPALTSNDTPTIQPTSQSPAKQAAPELSYNSHVIVAKYVSPPIHEIVGTSNPSAKESNPKRIAICIDEGSESQFALTWALEHLTDIEPSHSHDTVEFILLNVRPFAVPEYFIHPSKHVPSAATDLDEEYVETVETFNKEKSHDILMSSASKVSAKGFAYKAIALRGDPRQEILKAVQTIKADCLVTGSRGLEETSFRGSLSDYLVHNATCAVIVPKICV
ncbi:UNVERIFIED_CONTAM: hypothetical protein HDU68_009227 [Siphonaria sp. JEL0065]|nr:hypothetical protein HDU68_009227 [Siphonaria sp. JEL0065]